MKIKNTILLIVILLCLMTIRVYGFNNNSFDDDMLISIGRSIGLVFMVYCLVNFGGKGISYFKDRLIDGVSSNRNTKDKRLARQQEKIEKQRKRAAKKHRNSNNYHNDEAGLENLIVPLYIAEEVGEWCIDKGKKVGRWCIDKGKKGAAWVKQRISNRRESHRNKQTQ